MKIVIMGCGRVGARLAQLFDMEGHEVSVVDLHAESFARLGSGFRGTTFAGTGIDEDVLRAVGIEKADLFLAVTQVDNANIMAAQIAKMTFRVPRTIARIYEPDREETFHRLGLETICPTTLVANRVYEAVSSGNEAHTPQIEPVAMAQEAVAVATDDGAANGHVAHDDHDAQQAPQRPQSLRQRFFR